MKTRNRFKRLLLTCAAMSLLLWSLSISKVQAAANAKEYTYKMTIFAGNQGIFIDKALAKIVVTKKDRTKYNLSQILFTEDKITIEGLQPGDVVSMDMMEYKREGGAVTDKEEIDAAVHLTDSRYYVKGVRESGFDNSEVSLSAVTIKEDAEYVVAYGIKGDMVSYVVNYQDVNGNTLAPSKTYLGNKGDRPVAAYQYIEGYQPTSYNLTKTLSVNEAENVFTFVYSAHPTTAVNSGEGEGEGVPGADAAPGAGTLGGAAEPGAAVPGEAPGGNVEPGGDAPGGNVTSGEDANQNPDNPEVEEDTPDELTDLDEDEVPLANNDEENGAVRKSSVVPIIAGIAIAVLAVISILIIVWHMHRMKKKSKND